MDATYTLIVQCMRAWVGVVAEFTANTPFPHFAEDAFLELPDCNPTIWRVKSHHTRIGYDERQNLNCVTIVIVDSHMLDDDPPPEIVRSN